MKHQHVYSLVRVLSEVIGGSKVRLGAEVGVWKGETSAPLLGSFPDLHLYMVDIWYPNRKRHRRAKAKASEATYFAQDRTTMMQTDSREAALSITDESLDFVFIDANHFYGEVKRDIEAYYPKVRSGGVLAGHDYVEKKHRRFGWGVNLAVNEFAQINKYQVNVYPGNVWWIKVR